MKLSLFETLKKANMGSEWVSLDGDQLKELQKVIIDMTKDIVDFCLKNDIKVFLGGGSCLGALRHKGIIPWDDDMDLMMPRRDYDYFRGHFLEEYGDKYWLHTPEKSKNYESLMAKVVKKGTVLRGYEDYGKDERGVFVDIFPVENTYDDRLRYTMHGAGCISFSAILALRRAHQDYPKMKELFSGNKEVLSIFRGRAIAGTLVSFWSMEKWIHIANNWYRQCRNENTKRVVIPTGRQRFFKETYDKSDFSNMNMVPFGDNSFPIINNADAYLTKLYGDYMQIPPEDKREKHQFIEFKL